MRWGVDVVAAMGALALPCVGCSSATFEVAEAPDVSVDASTPPEDATPIDAAVDTTVPPTDTASPVDAASDVPPNECPARPSCSGATCGALYMKNLEAMSAKNAPAFDTTGFRCKTLTLCGVAMSCIYYDSANIFGTLQSQEPTFYDGSTAPLATATKLRLGGGAASHCSNDAVTFNDGDFLTLKFDGGKVACVFLPKFAGPELTLFIAADGSTFYDATLTKPAKQRP